MPLVQQQTRWWFSTAILAVLGIVGYLYLAPLIRQSPSPSQQIHALLEIEHVQRFFDARLPGTAYRPRPAVKRTAGIVPERLTVALRLKSFGETLSSGTGDYAAALALSALHAGDVDAAIELLREAVYLEPRQAAYWTDLAAASLVRGRATDFLHALDAADTALEISPALPAAAFNRALAFERIGLAAAAREAWMFAQETGEGGWSAEAMDRRAALSTAVPLLLSADELLAAETGKVTEWSRDSLDRIRQLIEEDLMVRVSSACGIEMSMQCAQLVERVSGIASAVSKTTPDRWWEAVARQLATWATATRQRVPVADLKSYTNAVSLFSRDQVADAAKIFNDLIIRRVDPTISVHFNSSYYACVDYYYRGQNTDARQCLDALDKQLANLEFLFMRGKVDWARAQISFAEGDLARAGSDFERAARWLQQAGDTNQLAALESLRASLRDQLGLFEEAWSDRSHALTHARLDARRRHTLYTSAARSCLLQRLPRAALHFQRAAVANATEWGQPGALVEAHLGHASGLQRLGRVDLAEDQVAAARKHFDEIPDARTRGRFQSELAVTDGEVLVATNPTAALAALGDAAATVSTQQLELLRARVEYATGVASERLGQFAGARAAFERGVSIIERQREPLAPSLQVQSIDLAWDIYDRLISRRLADDGQAAALAVAESARSQVLRRFATEGGQPLPPVETIGALLPPRAVLIYFQVLEQATLRWTISRDGVEAVQLPVGRLKLEYLARRVQRALSQESWATELSVTSLPILELLFAGAHDLAPGTTLVVVPDGALHEVPFAGLLDTQTSRFLIEDHAIAVAPSLRTFLTASQAARERFPNLKRALVVEGRTGTAAGQPTLEPLVSGQEEIRAVAAAYPDSHVLRGMDATPERFLADSASFPVVHFTGHALADRLSPHLSRLFLAPSQTDPSGWLLFRDLEAATFPRTALVVLAACSTGAGRIFRGEGAISLARPFLGKGAAGVVYSLWDVSDVPSTRLLTDFHRGIGSGLDPVDALAQAQRAAVLRTRTVDDIRTWAAFQYAGGIRARSVP